MGFGKAAGQLFGGVMDLVGANKVSRQQDKAARRRKELIEGLDWEPEYAGDHLVNPETGDASITRAKSPTANLYLDSFLGGYNADTLNPNDPMYEEKRAQYEREMDKRHGSWSGGDYVGARDTAAKEEKRLRDTPIVRVTPITRDVQDKSPGAASKRGVTTLSDIANRKARRELQPEGAYPPSEEEVAKLSAQYERQLYEKAKRDGVDVNNNEALLGWYRERYGQDVSGDREQASRRRSGDKW